MTTEQKKWLKGFANDLPEGHTKNSLLLWLEDADELTDSQLNSLEGLFKNTDQCEEMTKFITWVKDRPQKPPHIP